MNPNMPPFAFQKTVFCTTKGHLLPPKRPPFANSLVFSAFAMAF